jgi:hypothetical protein
MAECPIDVRPSSILRNIPVPNKCTSADPLNIELWIRKEEAEELKEHRNHGIKGEN